MAVNEIQFGVAHVFGNDGIIIAIGATVFTSGTVMDNFTIEDLFQFDEIKGQNGDTQTLIASDRKRDITIDFMPAGTSKALAITMAQAVMASPFAIVAITGSLLTTTINASYRYIGGATLKFVRDAPCVANMKCRTYLGNTSLNTALVLT